MPFKYWTEDGERHFLIGRLHGVSPGKHGPKDWAWSFPPNDEPTFPTVAEAVALPQLLSLAQIAVFDPPPESAVGIHTRMLRMLETETEREAMSEAQLIAERWERQKIEAAMGRNARKFF